MLLYVFSISPLASDLKRTLAWPRKLSSIFWSSSFGFRGSQSTAAIAFVALTAKKLTNNAADILQNVFLFITVPPATSCSTIVTLRTYPVAAQNPALVPRPCQRERYL